MDKYEKGITPLWLEQRDCWWLENRGKILKGMRFQGSFYLADESNFSLSKSIWTDVIVSDSIFFVLFFETTSVIDQGKKKFFRPINKKSIAVQNNMNILGVEW